MNGDEIEVDGGGSCGNPKHCYTHFSTTKNAGEAGVNCGGGGCDNCHCFDGFVHLDRRDSAEDFFRLDAPIFTAMTWIFIPAYCFAIP